METITTLTGQLAAWNMSFIMSLIFMGMSFVYIIIYILLIQKGKIVVSWKGEHSDTIFSVLIVIALVLFCICIIWSSIAGSETEKLKAIVKLITDIKE